MRIVFESVETTHRDCRMKNTWMGISRVQSCLSCYLWQRFQLCPCKVKGKMNSLQHRKAWWWLPFPPSGKVTLPSLITVKKKKDLTISWWSFDTQTTYESPCHRAAVALKLYARSSWLLEGDGHQEVLPSSRCGDFPEVFGPDCYWLLTTIL